MATGTKKAPESSFPRGVAALHGTGPKALGLVEAAPRAQGMAFARRGAE